MEIRIEARYFATDGSMPESIEVEIKTVEPAPTAEVINLVTALIDHAAQMPKGRPTIAVTTSTGEFCSRTLCGCPEDVHSTVDDQGNVVGKGAGMCSVCNNPDKCRSFVPRRAVLSVKNAKAEATS